MPLILLLPLIVAGAFALWVLLLPISVIQRYRFGKARRRVQPWFVRANAWVLLVSGCVFVTSAWVLANWIEGALFDALAGLGVGGVAGLLGLALDRFENTPQGAFRTPNHWLVLGLSLLLAGRIAMGLWLAWSDGPGTGMTAWITRGGLIAVAGVLLGYAVATAWGLRYRLGK